MANGVEKTKVLSGVAGGGRIEVVDAGDIEIIKIENEVLAILPTGKDVYLIGRHGLLRTPTKIRKLRAMT